ncbi:MAG: bifunctional methylenetetrahydrofolate dehydrogenase/methenyltetrahydrofolate cyclohydrolase [Bacilli bacterium]|nr:bifunctional methylenetetrahydrofolate dehydrogenase/methenyltetrahydrofolate cyclohydrolase [Bacilli bacterium]
MILLDGKKLSNEIIENIKEEINSKNIEIGFAVIWVGNDEASSVYVKNKLKKCEYVGIKTELFHLDENVSEKELINLINELNDRNDINGILLQSPVPKHINITNCFNSIDYKKDIDGFSNISVGNLYLGSPYHVSCTPKGIIKLLDNYNIDLDGKNVCLINRSNIVGKPLFHLLIERNATVTMCHSKTIDLKEFTKNADIVISAVGKPNFIKADMVKEDVVIIDVGISRIDGKVVGDVDFAEVSKKASYITPVPGGVGPMTIAMVLENILDTLREE